ncbi:restriction endonuclease subunit S [Janthinobacterium lividum]|uniref:Restriction endonuclease subunit S n=1 Tax=Janthinobacterium lividum TaxID=29581 RepID=A0ABU0XRS1_9BURK|nr:restriction endonuclease subunit S [Janthinobacterium lividum]MDQ4626220.1 restriction endonuclease subunit S [Janthinobacterium lividum]MDQ4674813.1 restriction endonuclease subunit S [Janthinobacterium lividum]MDQ4685545.1 restriction endonuclease subunit S [Janthinobacterium lividum]
MSTFDKLTFAPVYVTDIEGRQTGLFRAHKGRRLISAHRKLGTTPFVGASRVNNSITDFADTPVLFPGGWVTLIYNGDGGTGHAKYQPAPFSASDDVIALQPLSSQATEHALLLIASMLTHQCVPKFGFGYKLTLHRLARQKIMAPVTSNVDGEQVVDWDGLTRLGKELVNDAKLRMRAVRQLTQTDKVAEPELAYVPMLITDVFESMRAAGKWFDLSKAISSGNPSVPYVARSGGGNGIGALLPHQGFDPPNAGNAVTIGVSTSTVFYQPVPFYTSKEIQVLRHRQLSADNGPILVSLLREQMSKFQWGNGASLERLRATRIMVPVTTDVNGEQVVDWEGMGRYGRTLRLRAEIAMNVALNVAATP